MGQFRYNTVYGAQHKAVELNLACILGVTLFTIQEPLCAIRLRASLIGNRSAGPNKALRGPWGPMKEMGQIKGEDGT